MEGIRSTCPYCGVGCGVIAKPDGTVVGDPDHPANFGRLCSKGSALVETLNHEGRLLSPQIGGLRAGWDEAIDLVAKKFSAAIMEHGPESVAFYVSGQLLTEDYYVANKLIKGFMGSANIDTNSRLCMASSVAGHKRAFGTDTVPGTYEDLEDADLIVFVGSNLAWCHPVLFQRIAAVKEQRPKMRVVNIDPRRTVTCDLADLHLSIKPGTDVALFNGLLNEIAKRGVIDPEFKSHLNGLTSALEAAAADDPRLTGLDPQDLARFFDLWVGTQKVVTIYSQGVNQSASGSDKVNSILNCHLATGRIGKPGMGPFSVTGQPNAMGGREVGGLSNMLACHLDLENEIHRTTVQEYWTAPTMPKDGGLKAVDLFDAASTGKIKALWVMSTNPAVSMPDAQHVRAAIKACPFTVVSDIIAQTDTCELADVLVPAAGWGEKSGTVTNSDRTISRQRAFAMPPGEAKPDWQIICDVATKMGWGDAFAFENPAAIFKEYAGLSARAAQLGKDFDISGHANISAKAYAKLKPTRWPYREGKSQERFFADGQFFTDNRKANMVSVRHRAPVQDLCDLYPLRLNTGRIRDQWHTMTRTGKSQKLSQHLAEPFVEMHPEDAIGMGIQTASLVRVTSPLGKVVLRAMVTDRTQKGSVFVPMHWTAQWASNARIDDLLASEVDPVSGQPELKAGIVGVTPFNPEWYGFAVSSKNFSPDTAYWAKAKTASGMRAELAGRNREQDWVKFARRLFGLKGATPISLDDHQTGIARVLLCEGSVPQAALFVSKTPVILSRNHVLAAFAEGNISQIMAGRPGYDQIDPGPTICSCFNVGANTITNAIETQKLISLEDIGQALHAGTNCGSCRPEMRALLNATHQKIAAE